LDSLQASFHDLEKRKFEGHETENPCADKNKDPKIESGKVIFLYILMGVSISKKIFLSIGKKGLKRVFFVHISMQNRCHLVEDKRLDSSILEECRKVVTAFKADSNDHNKKELQKLSEQIIGYQISTYSIPDIWKETEGEGVTVATCDTGLHWHIDLKGAILEGKNFSNSSTIEDIDGHQSHVNGILAAQNNDIGVVGVAPKAKVLTIKALGDDGSGSYEGIADAIRYAVDQGADIISLSLGGPDDVGYLHDAIKYAYNKNIPVVCASGNAGDIGELDYPGKYSETISIGALDQNKLRAGFSQTGPNLDFMSPGVEVLSTVPVNDYAIYSGTCLTGTALIETKHGPLEIKNIEAGNQVYSYNEKDKEIEIKTVKNAWNRGEKRVRKIKTNNSHLICTNNHPILTAEGWKKAENITLNCTVFFFKNNELQEEKIEYIEKLHDKMEVFDIEVEDNHNFIANKIVVHNSMATPWAAGVVALMMSKHRKIGGITPLETVEDVREHLKKIAIDLEHAGKDDKTGYGLIDVQKAIEAIQGETPEVPEVPPETPDFEGVIQMFNEIVVKIQTLADDYNAKIGQKEELEQQLATIVAELAVYEAKAQQINEVLNN